MKIFYPRTITKAFIKKSIANKIEGEILHYQIVSSERIKEPYQIKNEDYADYLKTAKKITNDVGYFIKDYLYFHPRERISVIFKKSVNF